MSKPILPVEITSVDGWKSSLKAVLDTGSHHTLIRQDSVPPQAMIVMYKEPRILGMAGKGSKLKVLGVIHLQYLIEGKEVEYDALVSPDLSQELLIGAGLMQAWDISILHSNGRTEIRVGHDLRDPDIQEID